MPEADINQILKNSVTAGDYQTAQGGVFYLSLAHHWNVGALPPDLNNASLKETDVILSSTPDHEAMWAAALFIAKTKISSLAWEVEGDIQLRVKRAQELLHASDMGRGWVSLIMKHLQDFLCTNNGAFIEIVRQGRSLNSQIISLVPLDSTRCTRTGDPEKPVIYTGLDSRMHEMQDYEVIDIVDEPSPRASLLGMGRCAAARAYKKIYELYSVESYISEKVSGRRPTDIHLVNGLNTKQLADILQTAQSQADAQGVISYMGAIVATIVGETQPGLVTIPLRSTPDHFDRRVEFDLALLCYADNIGLDPQDLQPLTGQNLGTGAQTAILDDKAKGRGLASWRQQFTHALDNWVIPDMTTFMFVEHDYRDQLRKAQVDAAIETYVNNSVKSAILTPAQGLQKLIDEEVYPDEFLPVDVTPDTALTDTEKPENELVEQPAAAAPVGATQPQTDAERLQIPTVAPLKEAKEIQPLPAGGMKIVIKRKGEPEQKSAPMGNSAIMPMLLALTLMQSGGELKGEDMSKLSDWIASLGKPAEKQAPEKKQTAVEGVEAVVNEDGNLVIMMPASYFNQKQNQDIVINIPAPIVNISNPAPVVNMPAPIVNIPAMKPPNVTLNPTIQVNMPEPKRGEFTVQRDNYGNVLGITEKQ